MVDQAEKSFGIMPLTRLQKDKDVLFATGYRQT